MKKNLMMVLALFAMPLAGLAQIEPDTTKFSRHVKELALGDTVWVKFHPVQPVTTSRVGYGSVYKKRDECSLFYEECDIYGYRSFMRGRWYMARYYAPGVYRVIE